MEVGFLFDALHNGRGGVDPGGTAGMPVAAQVHVSVADDTVVVEFEDHDGG